MPAGSDFVCENDKCHEYRKGVAIINIWPLGDIDRVIASRGVQKNIEFRNGMIALKEQGRKHACISYPDADNIPIAGYRVQKWCQGCFCIWAWDVMLEGEVADTQDASKQFQVALVKENIPIQCPRCNDELKDFQKIIDDGIVCPHCKEKMKTYTWFSNEREG